MNPLAVLMPGFEGAALPGWVEALLRDGLAGVCLFGTNVESSQQLRELTDAIYSANPHAVVTIDEEGGDVTRLYQAVGSPFPGNAILGRLDDEALTYAVGAQVGRELADAGVGMTLAPSADVNTTAYNPIIGTRSYSADVGVVSRHTAAWVRGIESTGVASCAKHFPGHGSTLLDSHVDLPHLDMDRDTVHSRALPPFTAAIEAGTQAIMSSHIVFPALDPHLPATLSRPILRDLLRDTLGFTGVVISDALDMAGASADRGIPAAAVAALDGGCDLLCIGTANTDAQMRAIVAAITEAIRVGQLDQADVQAAADRVAQVGIRLAQARAHVPAVMPGERGVVPGVTPAVVAAAFDVSEYARTACAVQRPRTLIRLETAPSAAVGSSPWGPFAVPGVTADVTATPDSDPRSVAGAVPSGSLAVVVGRDNHRHRVARAVVDALAADHHDVVVVDMGWPEPSEGLADISTFGASRLVGEALLDVVGWSSCASE